MHIALDTETELITPDVQAPRVVCVQLANDDGATIVHHSEALPILRSLLAEVHIIGAWIAYDMCCIAATWPELYPTIFDAYEQNRIQDVAINAKLTDIARGKYPQRYGLNDLSMRFRNRPLDKAGPWRLRYDKLRDTAIGYWPAEAQQYALDDAIATWDIWCEVGSHDDSYRQARADFALRLTSNHGLLTDRDAVNVLEQVLLAKVRGEAQHLEHVGFLRPNGVRAMKIAREYAATQGLSDSLAKDAIEDCGDIHLESLSRYNALSKKLSTDIPLLREGDTHRIHTRFEVLKETGRTGSSSPNVQNLDRHSGIRECFVPTPGYVFALGDYGKGELCTWSQICLWVLGRSRMANVLNAGGDPHLEIAAMIAGIGYAAALERRKDLVEERQAGKVANFGLPGGMGVERFRNYAKKQYGVILSDDMAKAIRNHWYAAWEGRPYFDWINSLLHGSERTTITQFVSNRVRGNVGYCDCANGFFQALLADAAKHAGFYVARACYAEPSSPLYGSRMVNFVHDEWITEVPEDRAHWAAIEQARIMHERAAAFIPDVTPQVEPLLARRWSKKAEPVYREGLLVPWE
jgi:hypothetical protein